MMGQVMMKCTFPRRVHVNLAGLGFVPDDVAEVPFTKALFCRFKKVLGGYVLAANLLAK